MVRNQPLSPKSFDEILAWLNPDRDVAATIYIQLRHDLTKLFTWNRCSDPEGLTDEVIDRVAKKVHELRQSFQGDPKLYFFGVARNLIKENPRKVKAQVPLNDADLAAHEVVEPEETIDVREQCLHSCLQKLSEEKRELILTYYANEKRAKIEHRTELARQLGTSVETLRVRAYRIRNTLEECIERCLRSAEGK
jgi:RNA polymerase sigma factor (sigma-70 family)